MKTNEQLVAEKNYNELLDNNSRYIEYCANQFYQDYEIVKDLEQVGRIGLYEAMTKYNPTKGVPFMKFASLYIKKEMLRYLIENGRTIRLPQNKIYDKTFVPTTNTISFEYQIGEDLTIGDLIQNSPVDENDPWLDRLPYLLEKLSLKDQNVVKKYHGFDMEEPMNFREIADELGQTHQAVSLAYKKAIKKLQTIVKE